MVFGKKRSKDVFLPSVPEDEAAETAGELEQWGQTGTGPLKDFSRESVDSQKTATQTKTDSGRPRGTRANSDEKVPDGGERGGEVEEIDKEQVEEKEVGDEQQGARACVMSADEDYDTDLEVEEKKKSYDHTGETRYMKACKKLQVVPACSFLRQMQNSEVSMMHYGLGPKGTKALAVALVTNTSVLRLNLRDNWTEGMGGAAVAEMLKENCYIKEVDLSDNRIGERGGKAIASMLPGNTTLVNLNLSGNCLNDLVAPDLGDALNANTMLKRLDLSHNALGELAGESLAECLSENSGLRSLSLAWNCIRGRGAVLLANSLRDNLFLRTLDVSCNGFGKEGAIALGEALKENSTLEELNVSNNQIPPEGAIRFAMGLRVNKTIKSLNIGRNPIQSAGCYGVLQSLQANPESAMEMLDFSDIAVNQDFEELRSAVKDILPSLVVKHGRRIGKPKAGGATL
ncbi:leucine-rich repeat-containing protein 74B [Myripristis murdjan]|uniref:leucine-rich repeat-containing protein 74B n=1 Tax=Myripristis murdjan TaxID=586833 RepID=UPI001176351A|nr:leucine-rich repeat-containing protein 74B [Myripristis murdjan]